MSAGTAAGGEFARRARAEASGTLAHDPEEAMVLARSGLDRAAEAVIAHAILARYPNATRAQFVHDYVTNTTVPSSVITDAGDEIFEYAADEEKLELFRSTRRAILNLSYHSGDGFELDL